MPHTTYGRHVIVQLPNSYHGAPLIVRYSELKYNLQRKEWWYEPS